MALKLIFTENSPLDTTLVDEASGAVMYETETERGFFSKTTVIRKPHTGAFLLSIDMTCISFLTRLLSMVSDRPGEPVHNTSTEVARIQRNSWSSDMVVYDRHEMRIEEFMHIEGLFNRCVTCSPEFSAEPVHLHPIPAAF